MYSENKIVNGVFLIKIKETSFNNKKKMSKNIAIPIS